MTAQELWQQYCSQEESVKTEPFEIWAFGAEPDVLADLVKRGIKTATASMFDLYALDSSEPMPKAGDYSVIIDSNGEAVCVIQTTKVYSVPFTQVTPAHAYLEGEGDRSLSYWRMVHWDFFTKEAREYGIDFSENSKVLCEEFEVRYCNREVRQ